MVATYRISLVDVQTVQIQCQAIAMMRANRSTFSFSTTGKLLWADSSVCLRVYVPVYDNNWLSAGVQLSNWASLNCYHSPSQACPSHTTQWSDSVCLVKNVHRTSSLC